MVFIFQCAFHFCDCGFYHSRDAFLGKDDAKERGKLLIEGGKYFRKFCASRTCAEMLFRFAHECVYDMPCILLISRDKKNKCRYQRSGDTAYGNYVFDQKVRDMYLLISD